MNKNKTQTKSKQNNNKKQQKPEQAKYIADNSTLEITIPWSKIEPVYEKTLKSQAKEMDVEGFRKGKVPIKIAEKKIGLEKLFQATLRKLLPEYYQKAIKDADKKPLTSPEFQGISLNKGNDWVVKAYFAEKPEIKLGNYKKAVKQAKKTAQEKIKKAQEQKAKQQAEKQAQEEKSDDQEKKEKTNDEKKEESGLSDKQKKDITIQTIFEKLIELTEPKIPELLVKQQTQREIKNLKQRLSQLKVELEDYLKSQNLSEQQMVSRMAYSSLNQLQVEFLMEAIAEREEVKVEQKEVDERIKQVEDEETQEKMRQDESYQNYLKSVIKKQKIMDRLLDL